MHVDLRSDTVTKPSKEMLDAMMQAQVGDDVFREDPTVNTLERKLAEMFGKEQALFFPSGTMANQTAIKLHTQPGEQLIADKWAHVYNYEGGGVSFNSGVSCKLVDGHRGMMTATQVEAAINPPEFYHSPLTSLVSLENTTNKGGGACWDFQEILKVRSVCDSYKLGLHLDGARIFNAMVETGQAPAQFGAWFDTLSVCLSKGLGAPVGSLMLSTKDRVVKARPWRKRYGGGMRQAGILAAAAHYALDTNLPLLKNDHIRAKKIAVAIAQVAPKIINPDHVETNIVGLDITSMKISAAQLSEQLKASGILASALGPKYLRMVTHLDLTDADVEKVNQVLPQLLQRALVS